MFINGEVYRGGAMRKGGRAIKPEVPEAKRPLASHLFSGWFGGGECKWSKAAMGGGGR